MKSGSTALTLQNAKDVQKAWELFVTGDEHSLEKVRPEIRESWRRSKQAGVDPAIKKFPLVLSSEDLDQKCRQNAYLLDAGHAAIDFLSPILHPAVFIIAILDCNGNLLLFYSPPYKHCKWAWDSVNAVPGISLSESLVGTAPSAVALSLNKPAQVFWYEYYAEFMQHWAGSAVPIHSYGDTIGALTISGYQEMAHPRALELVVAAGRFIEERVKYHEEQDHLRVLEKFSHYSLRYPDSSLLALCSHGRILALSPALAKLATWRSPERLIGQRLCDIPDFQVEGLFPASAGALSESYEASIILPQKEGKKGSCTVTPVLSREGQQTGLILIASGLDRTVSKRAAKPSWQAAHTFHDLVGGTPIFGRALQLAEKAAAQEWPVLLVGESGTGKGLFAQSIHRASRRASGPFVTLNCSTIPKDLMASELFGYEEGAFSGALRGGKRGKVALAEGGTLFLDEVEDMPLETQVSLLHFLEDGQIVPLGSERPQRVDVRVIAAMNVEPAKAVAQGKLRLDLYHRLNVIPLVLPPLRDRLEDLPLLIRHLLDREGFPEAKVSPEVMAIFHQYSWPGNIRELRNVLLRAVLDASNQYITLDTVPTELLTPQLPPSSPLSVRQLEEIRCALQKCEGNVSQAAKLLGIHWVTLYRKMRKYGLTQENCTKKK